VAEVPYSGVSEVSPQVQAPDDYQHIQTNPAQFGAGLGQGLDELGAGMTKAALFYGQAAADNAANNYQTTVNNLLHGDPNKMIAGPDGQQIPDTGYMGLKGRAALDARPGVTKAMDDARQSTLNTLQTPEQRLQFDNFSRRYSSMAAGQMGSHSDQQANVWYGQVNKDTAELALGHIATNFDNPTMVQNGIHDLRDAYAKNAQLEGAQPGDPVYNAAIARADRDAIVAQANAQGVRDPAGALALVEKNKQTLGVLYDNVANSLRSRADQQSGQAAGAAAIKDATEAPPIHARANYATVQNMGDPSSAGWQQQNIVPIKVGDQSVSVNRQAAPAFQGFLDDLKAHGYNAENVGGFNYRNKVGTGSGLSQHAFGNAIDLNPEKNAQGQSSNDFGNIDIRALAAKHGLVWGGDWKGAQRDPMHFEWAGPNGLQPRQNPETVQMFSGLEQHYSLPPGYLARTAQIESGGRDVTNSIGAAGVFQFVPKTAAAMHVDPHNLESSADGAARLAVENSQRLRLGLGREPDGAELYLAHQQGGVGATKLLTNPNANAASLVGTKAIIQNGGTENMTAGQFTQMWANKYNGTKGATNVVASPGPQANGLPNTGVQPTAGPGNEGISTAQLALMSGVANAAPPAPSISTDQAPQVQSAPSQAAPAAAGPMSVKADAYQRVMDDPSLSVEARQHALQYINQTLASQQIAYEQDQRAKKEANDQAADQIVQRIQSGNYTGVMDDINHNPGLNWETRIRLRDVALKESDNGAGATTASYGSGFWDAMKGITAQPGDPTRITDPNELLKRAGPGGDLSLAGATKLTQIMRENQKSPDQAAVSDMQRGALAYLKHNLSFSADYGTFKVPDPVGEDIFNSQAIPAFWKAYGDGVQSGKTPFQLLSKDSPDFIGSKIISAYKRSDAQEMKDRIASGEGAAGGPQAAAAQSTAAPPPPEPSTFKLETPEGIAQAYHAGSLSRAEAEQRLNALRNALGQVPNK
jgi:hypothetical protein